MTSSKRLAEPPRLVRNDRLGSVGVFLPVFFSTLPVVIPFLFIGEARIALRSSNAIAIGMLFLGGVAYGHHAGLRRGVMGLAMVVPGAVLVAMTIALGG